MAIIVSTALIHRPKAEVFDFLVDLRNELIWNPDVVSMELLSPEPIGLGSRYLAKWKQSGRIQVECTGFDRPDGWTYLNGGPVAVTFDVRLTEEDGATRLVSRFDARPRGMFRLIFPFFMMIMRRQERTNMRNLTRALEHPDQIEARA
jgi:hypothetical protein